MSSAKIFENVTIDFRLEVSAAANGTCVYVRSAGQILGHWAPQEGWTPNNEHGKSLPYFAAPGMFSAIVRVWIQANEEKERGDAQEKTEE